MDAVQHFEVPYKVRERAKKFYFGAFGWQLFDTPGSPYTFAATVEMEPNGMPKRPGAINGGLVPRGKEVTGPTLFVRVGDLDAHLERIRHAGGTVLTQPQAQGPVRFARFRDPEGNVMTVFQQTTAAREEGGAGAKQAPKRGRAAGARKASKPSKRGSARRGRSAKAAATTKGIKPQRKPTGMGRSSPGRKAREAPATWSR